MKLKNIILISLFVFQTANADVNGSVNKFFNELNFTGSNYTKAEAWKGQAAGYITGGGIYARTSNTSIQLASISLPSVSAGCGGIDVYLGAFSFISSDELMRFVKAMMSNAPGFAFDLALDTLAPELKSIKDHLQTIVNAVNDTNMSSCQAAQALVGGIGSAVTGSKEHLCNSMGTMSNAFSDYVQSRMECGVGGQTDSMARNAKKDKALEEQSLIDVNLSWKYINDKASNTIAYDKESKEFMMSIMGTMIFDSESKVKRIPPSLDNDSLISALLNGGKAEIYGCDNENCLNPKLKTVTIKAENGLLNRVSKLTNSIIDKVEKDSPALTKSEQDFINSTNVPILKYIIDPMQVEISRSIISNLINYISSDILYLYLNDLIRAYDMSASNSNTPKDVAIAMDELTAKARLQLNSIRERLQTQQTTLLVLEQQMSYIRTQASTNLFSRFLNNYNFEE